MDAADEEGGQNGTSTPRRRVGLASLVGHPSPAEQHPRSYCLLSSDITTMVILPPPSPPNFLIKRVHVS